MAHTLTARWYQSSTSNYVTVNGEKVDVPYELKNEDIIRIHTNNGDGSSIYINGNTFDMYGNLDLSNTDIVYEENEWGPIMPGDDPGPIITINYTETASISFKHFFRNSPIGTGTIRFRPYTVTEPLSQLSTPANVSADGTTVSWDAVENAASYAVLADGSEIGTVEKATGYKVSLIYTDDFVSGIFAYSLDGGSTYQDITTSDIRLTNVTQIRLKSHGLDAGTEIFQAEYGISTPSGTSISPPIGGADKNPYELDNIILTADTGFFFYTYYD